MAKGSSGTKALPKQGWLSLDAWAVIVALVLALAVKFGVLKSVPW
jgi:hypothetical protein